MTCHDMPPHSSLTRRRFTTTLAAAAVASGAASLGRWPSARAEAAEGDAPGFQLRYILASCMYGRLPVAEILPEVARIGAQAIDIWPERHGNQREQVEEMGHETFRELLAKHQVKVGIYTCYNPGVLKSQPWMEVVKQFGGSMIISNTGGPARLEGDPLRDKVRQFAEQLKPQLELAESLGVTIGIENHSGSFINSLESQRMLLDLVPSPRLGIALAPYHLPQDAEGLGKHIRTLGERLVHFYAWEHGDGCMTKLPKVQEMKQLPGYGPLDFAPLIAALKQINYRGWTSIFMHPVPRGIPILPTAAETTAAINRSREYLESLL